MPNANPLAPALRSQLFSFDLFCTVVDNYGDIGVCWRLARQLAVERQQTVRLWVDDLKSFARLCPAVDPALERQSHLGVEILRWSKPFPEDVEPADTVIEAFACELPESFIAAMARREPKPRWINLEYLSAEDWVKGCHGLPSPHPRLPLLKHFFFPGFTAGTGGLILEDGLLAARDAFQSAPDAQARFWQQLGVPGKQPGELRLSLFSYPNPAMPDLLDAWAAFPTPVVCVVPEGTAAARLAAEKFGGSALAGSHCGEGSLTVHVHPFVEQPDYDRLLWACDLNFVRGEDSFVRAQWAGRPFVWHIYPQEEDAHHVKLEAFLELYCQGLPSDVATPLREFWHYWNGSTGLAGRQPFALVEPLLPEVHAWGPQWAKQLAELGGLAENLMKNCESP